MPAHYTVLTVILNRLKIEFLFIPSDDDKYSEEWGKYRNIM
jgi:hypothetical protein